MNFQALVLDVKATPEVCVFEGDIWGFFGLKKRPLCLWNLMYTLQIFTEYDIDSIFHEVCMIKCIKCIKIYFHASIFWSDSDFFLCIIPSIAIPFSFLDARRCLLISQYKP